MRLPPLDRHGGGNQKGVTEFSDQLLVKISRDLEIAGKTEEAYDEVWERPSPSI